jgi:hypothetical protein
MDGAAAEPATSASASKAAAAATTAAGKCVVGNQCRANQHDCREKYQSIPHDTPLCCLVPMLSIELRVRARDVA